MRSPRRTRRPPSISMRQLVSSTPFISLYVRAQGRDAQPGGSTFAGKGVLSSKASSGLARAMSIADCTVIRYSANSAGALQKDNRPKLDSGQGAVLDSD